jgi:hypothetical protein
MSRARPIALWSYASKLLAMAAPKCTASPDLPPVVGCVSADDIWRVAT